MLKKHIQEVGNAVENAVGFVSQTYVDKLKESGEWSADNQRSALSAAVGAVKNMLSADAVEYINSCGANPDEYIQTLVEAYLYRS